MTDAEPDAPRAAGTTDPAGGLLGAADIRALAARLGVRPTKTLGQNFVVDAGTVRKIVRIAGTGPGDVVLEVGPGLGSLTLALLETGAHVVAIEIDPVLAAALTGTVAQHLPEAVDRLVVVESDAMDITELPTLADGRAAVPDSLVANLPYNVAVPVLLTLLERVPSLRHALVMVQAEVADRLAAPPGSRTYGVPSAKAAWYAHAHRSATIGRSVFWPVPNVDSALVRLERRNPPSTTAERAEVFAVIDAAFGQRRKTLRSALAGWAGSPTRAAEAVTAAGLDPTLRGERLDVGDFARIAEHRPPAVDG